MEPGTECNHWQRLARQNWAPVVILIVMLPSFYWIASDHHVWPWDQAWYGEVSVGLWYKLTRHILKWAPAMMAAFGSKSPGIAWFGQFFVPLGRAMGSMETALLLSVVTTQIGSIVLFYKVAEEFAPGRRLVAAVAILLFAGAPLFVAMSHQYFPEPLQLFGVTYFYYLAATGHKMHRLTLLGNLMLATAIALLAKMTAPIYCVLPGLIATYAFFEKQDSGKKEEAPSKPAYRGWLWLLAGVVLCLACARWYVSNLPALREALKLQTSLEFTSNYGRPGTFLEKLSYWLHALQWSFQFPWVIAGQLVLLGIGVGLARIRGGDKTKSRETGKWRFHLLTIFSVIHILAVLSLCSLNYNEENRYLLPLLPAIATVNIWLICKIRQPWLIAGVILLLCAQWIAVCSQALGWARLDPRQCSYWVIPLDRNWRPAKEIGRIVHHTAHLGKSRYNIVGVELPWLNANTLSFFAAKEELKTRSRCYYTSLGYGAKDLDLAWKRMSDLKVDYFISLEEKDQPANPNFVNLISTAALQRVRDDPDFVPVPFTSDLGVVVYRKKTESPAPASGTAPQ